MTHTMTLTAARTTKNTVAHTIAHTPAITITHTPATNLYTQAHDNTLFINLNVSKSFNLT